MTTPLALAILLTAGPGLNAAPWWDDYPITVQSSDPDTIEALGADSAVCGLADDPGWGVHGARTRLHWLAERLEPIRQQGVKLLCWSETFGTCEQYIAEFEELPDGTLRGFELEPDTPQPMLNHWGWHTWKPLEDRVLGWIGLPSYFEGDRSAGPWNRTHERYGCPVFTYPDGREALGYIDEDGFRKHRLYDAACSKDVLGKNLITFGRNAAVNEVDEETGEVKGPIEGLVPHETGDGTKYSGLLSFGKDSAFPGWIDYAKVTARHMADNGVTGIWSDNFSAWDSFGNPPTRTAFGEWSVHRFRKFLTPRFTDADLADMGIADVDTFDVREYVRRIVRDEFGGDDTNLLDAAWHDPRWLDEPIWRAYRIYKSETGRDALQAYHDTYVREGREAGIDFVIQGNDIPLWCFDWPRPESLHMVSTEFAPGWNLIGGPRGLGLPPTGRISPIVKMARRHARSRFVHLWYYLDQPYEKYHGNAPLGRVLSYELLAHHAMIQAYPSQAKVAGTVESHREVADFIHAAKETWGDREPLARIALLYSPDSRLTGITPGAVNEFAAQRHVFDLIGWGTALSEFHAQYDVIAEWELETGRLDDFGALIVPSVEVLSELEVTDTIGIWVALGGTLVVSGPVGARHGRDLLHERVLNEAEMVPALCWLADLDPDEPRPETHECEVGDGRIVFVPALGFDYYQTDFADSDIAAIQRVFEAELMKSAVTLANAPREVEISAFTSPEQRMLSVDIANLDLDPDVDAQPAPHDVIVTCLLTGAADEGMSATVLRPGEPPQRCSLNGANKRLSLGPVRVDDYASVVVQGWGEPQ